MAGRDEEEEHRKMKAVRECTVDLCRDINTDDLTAALYAKGLLTTDEVERLGLPIMTTREKNLYIVTKLPSKGPKAFDYFVDALQATSEENPAHSDLVDLLMKAINNA